MNEAVHQLMQVILQGVTWVLRTIERLWVWSWGQIDSAFNISWGNLPAWKIVVGVIALAVEMAAGQVVLRTHLARVNDRGAKKDVPFGLAVANAIVLVANRVIFFPNPPL